MSSTICTTKTYVVYGFANNEEQIVPVNNWDPFEIAHSAPEGALYFRRCNVPIQVTCNCGRVVESAGKPQCVGEMYYLDTFVRRDEPSPTFTDEVEETLSKLGLR